MRSRPHFVFKLLSSVTFACLASITTTGARAQDAPEQIRNGSFDGGTDGWGWYGVNAAGVANGELCARVPGGLINFWDAGILQNVPLVAGSAYTFSFRARTDAPGPVRVAIQLGTEPFTAALDVIPSLTSTSQLYSFTFTSVLNTADGQLAFQVGTGSVERTICLDDVSLKGGVEIPPYKPDTGPRVRVNQVGYLPDGPKRATVVTDSAQPVSWELKDPSGAVVASGTATPRGVDEASQQRVQTIDFSEVSLSGRDFTLTADGETSHPFDIRPDLYAQLRSDSLQFFYLQRSGLAIDGSLVGQQYARPAGHLQIAPNQGDFSVPCQPGVCDYRLDVSGGWYDAGDQGKYVVNGGIAAYQLMSIAERSKTAATAQLGDALADGSLRVPEHGNRLPDVLDEARWEIEFLLRMQVPAGQPLAGMAHHKMHDREWTALPTLPHLDAQLRELHPPSTAATLNLAAVAAQCARLYVSYVPRLATRCLTAARTAYAAAQANPARFASPSDGVGGGSYSDGDVSDEFYWAAAELYLTTGEAEYLRDLTASPHHTSSAVFQQTGFGWPQTAALARLDLATVPSALPDRERVKQSIIDAAEMYLSLAEGQAYGLPLPGAPWAYFWGSNSNIINNAVIIATAYDLTRSARYRDAALSAMDYIFGRNALNHSYVTGWGERNPRFLHHRWYATDAASTLPPPPAGTLTGGANAQLNDPFANQLLGGCAPQMCYVDDAQSFSTNEPAINYVSALAWMASFLADQGDPTPRVQGTCRVQYTSQGVTQGGGVFKTEIVVTNTSARPVQGWTLRFAFNGGQRVKEFVLGRGSQAGPLVTIANETGNGTIPSGASVRVRFSAATPGGLNPAPELFMLNGAVCDN